MLSEHSRTMDTGLVSPITFDDWASRNQAFSELAAFRHGDPIGVPERQRLEQDYATELLTEAAKNPDDPNYGNAIYDANEVLGRVALRHGDIAHAGILLLEAGRTPGSLQLSSLGPDMTLTLELLEKGERTVVLQFFDLCRRFWPSGLPQLDAWSRTVREGGIPKFGANLR
jgi:hypothetical protein